MYMALRGHLQQHFPPTHSNRHHHAHLTHYPTHDFLSQHSANSHYPFLPQHTLRCLLMAAASNPSITYLPKNSTLSRFTRSSELPIHPFSIQQDSSSQLFRSFVPGALLRYINPSITILPQCHLIAAREPVYYANAGNLTVCGMGHANFKLRNHPLLDKRSLPLQRENFLVRGRETTGVILDGVKRRLWSQSRLLK